VRRAYHNHLYPVHLERGGAFLSHGQVRHVAGVRGICAPPSTHTPTHIHPRTTIHITGTALSLPPNPPSLTLGWARLAEHGLNTNTTEHGCVHLRSAFCCVQESCVQPRSAFACVLRSAFACVLRSPAFRILRSAMFCVHLCAFL